MRDYCSSRTPRRTNWVLRHVAVTQLDFAGDLETRAGATTALMKAMRA
jgi:hypothetical protein